MIVAVDVDYRDDPRVKDPRASADSAKGAVVAACVGWADWPDAQTELEVVVRSDAPPAPYEPGRFYLRELPHLQSVLALVPSPVAIVVDGYAWLAPDRPGLGAHLYDALGGAIPVIGVAKNPFVGAAAIEVLRGTSLRPLYVTAIGIDATVAADGVRAMHGAHRIPTLLGRVDQLARAS